MYTYIDIYIHIYKHLATLVSRLVASPSGSVIILLSFCPHIFESSETTIAIWLGLRLPDVGMSLYVVLYCLRNHYQQCCMRMWDMSNCTNMASAREWYLPSYFCLFLLQALLNQDKTSTKQKTKKTSVTLHMICGNNNSLCREMLAQMKQVK